LVVQCLATGQKEVECHAPSLAGVRTLTSYGYAVQYVYGGGRGWCDRPAPATGGVADVTVAQCLPTLKSKVWRLRGMSPANIVIGGTCDAKPPACEIQTCMANSASFASARTVAKRHEDRETLGDPRADSKSAHTLPVSHAQAVPASRFCRGRQRQLRDPVRSGESRSHPMWPSMHGRGPWAMFRSTRLKPGSWFSQAFRSADLFAEHESKTIIMAIIHGSNACLSACLLPAAEHVSPGLPVRQCKRLVMTTAAQPGGFREFSWRKKGAGNTKFGSIKAHGRTRHFWESPDNLVL